MTIGIDNALGIAPQAMALRAQRTTLLANNLANADTPGFKARDLDFKAILEANMPERADGLNLKRSHASHMKFSDPASGAQGQLMYRVPLMPALDGNSVDTQMEQAEFAENSTQFLASLRILNGRLKGMMSAIKGE